MRGPYLGLEGGEGCGKDEHIKLVAGWISEMGFPVTITREPGGTASGERIRRILKEESIDSMTELFLFEAARSQLIREVVAPELAAGHAVLTSRTALSSIVYQGIASNLGAEIVEQCNDWSTDGIYPDITIVINVPPELGLSRETEKDVISNKGLEYHRKVNQAYVDYAAAHPDRFKIVPYIDGAKHPKSVEGAMAEMQTQIRTSFEQVIKELCGHQKST